MKLVRRRIDVTVSLGEGQFGDEDGEAVTLTGHRVQANIEAYGGDTQGMLQIRIYGLPLSMINKLTCIGPIETQIRHKNSIMVAAGDDGSALSTIYIGTIDQAWGDFQAMPDVALNINAYSAIWAAVKPVAATSYKGEVTVSTIMSTLAKTMGVSFVNSGAYVTLTNPYFPGTALSQVQDCAQAAGINYKIELGALTIWPRDGYIESSDIPLISPETGLVGYPSFSSSGVALKSLFLPNVRQGALVEVESSITPACGPWKVLSVTHNLETETPGGAWFTNVVCSRPPVVNAPEDTTP